MTQNTNAKLHGNSAQHRQRGGPQIKDANLYLVISVDQSGDDVISNAPGGLALPQQVRWGIVGYTSISRPHLDTQGRLVHHIFKDWTHVWTKKSDLIITCLCQLIIE